ncbi:MAG: HNH endonuclease signature motif containing protein, partial [Acidimicrobiia bacterium]
RMPAFDCDLDHRKAYSKGGPTHNHNLGPLCRYHHMAKHHAPWGLQRLSNGDHSWTSPLNHVYIRRRAPPPSSF